jgi:hypothetical protein
MSFSTRHYKTPSEHLAFLATAVEPYSWMLPDLILKINRLSIGWKSSGWKYKSNRKNWFVLKVWFEWSGENTKTSLGQIASLGSKEQEKWERGKGKSQKRNQRELERQVASYFPVQLHPNGIASAQPWASSYPMFCMIMFDNWLKIFFFLWTVSDFFIPFSLLKKLRLSQINKEYFSKSDVQMI